jgi:hypothetical protein
LLEQARITLGLLVAFVDLAGALLLDDFADHLLAADPHAEVAHARGLGDRERVERLDDAVFGVHEHLVDLGNGDAVVDRDVHVLLFDFKRAAEPAVGDQEAGRVGVLAA